MLSINCPFPTSLLAPLSYLTYPPQPLAPTYVIYFKLVEDDISIQEI
jgi:hypothetical protein